MDFITITCPHCGYSKSVARGLIPKGAKSTTCPKCRQSFLLADTPESRSAEQESAWTFHAGAGAGGAGDATPPARETAADPAGNHAIGGEVKFCPTCGQKLHVKAEICSKCGVRVAPAAGAVSKVALLLITFFLGGIGAHKFYQKKYLAGVLYLLFCWTYIPGLIALVEFIIYACKSEEELQQKYPDAGGAGVVLAILVPFFALAVIGILAAIAIPQFAAYRQKAANVSANQALRSCKVRAEAYFADRGAYPTAAGQLQCDTPARVSLYYLSLGPEEYQIIGYHNHGDKAYVSENASDDISVHDKEAIEAELAEKYGAENLGEAFHFVE
jgi:TM2 domain-containing membrane protein YozV/transcription elongation factor Elf1